MDNREQTQQKSKRLKIVIIILAVLLLLSVGGTVRRIYLNFFAPMQTTATVPDNLIGDIGNLQPEHSATDSEYSSPAGSSFMADNLELYQGRPEDNQRFQVGDMFPGDSVTKYFCVKACHDKDILLFFRTNITEHTKNLGEALHIRVIHLETGKILCDAAFSEIDRQEFSELLKTNENKSTTAYYRIDVSLDASAGSEYQSARLAADFNWYVQEEGSLTPPQTGDNTNIVLWTVLSLSSLLLILLLTATKRRKGNTRHG